MTASPIRSLSYGAGVQSTALLAMAIHGWRGFTIDIAVFADTGAEPSTTHAAVAEWGERARGAGIRFEVVRSNQRPLLEALRHSAETGDRVSNPPLWTLGKTSHGLLRRKCTQTYKAQPVDRFLRELRGKRRVEQIFGISYDEMQRMKISQRKWSSYSYPLVDWRMTREDCEQWLLCRGYSVPAKSACVVCPYRQDGLWKELRDTDPNGWAQAVEADKAIRGGISGTSKQRELYLHRSCRPLDEQSLDGPEQLRLGFANECDGICGT